jgi:hypothetical protein
MASLITARKLWREAVKRAAAQDFIGAAWYELQAYLQARQSHARGAQSFALRMYASSHARASGVAQITRSGAIRVQADLILCALHAKPP